MPQESQSGKTQRGLAYWMKQVIEEAARARDGFAADPVHDLRVAIRRCRAIGEGFGVIDPFPAWKKMRRAAKPIFAALGELRDVQVLMEWVQKIGRADDAVSAKLLDHCQTRERELKSAATAALDVFDLAQWEQWIGPLEQRALHLPPGGEVFQVMALERWQHARALHTIALRNRSRVSLHELRIGIKKFRYVVENFLPELHDRWIKDLKQMQDVLGEVHDLDVLWDTAQGIHAFGTPDQRREWQETIKRERQQRIDVYREHMVGRQTLWQEWRGELPQGEALHAAVLVMFETWSQLRDTDIAHTRRVLEMSLAIFEQIGLRDNRFNGVLLRDLLTVAVLTHEVGHDHRRKHHKETVHMLDKLDTPPGWKPEHLHVAGMVARYHTGALPRKSQKNYAVLKAPVKRMVSLLGGVIRLADAFDQKRDGAIQQIEVSRTGCAFEIKAVGYDNTSREAEQIARARHLLETAIGVPILIRKA